VTPEASGSVELDGDSARAETELPVAPGVLLTFLADTRRLFHLNPHLEIERWESWSQGFFLAIRNELNDQRLATSVSREATPRGWLFNYAAGLKRATDIQVLPTTAGSRLIVTDYYPRIEDPEDPRVAGVDPSLVPWVAAVRRHLLARQRWGWLPGWRGWHERLMPGMTPRQRRIARLIVWTSLLEFVLFIGLVVVLGVAA
jgi:hypothetical protein